MALLLTVLLVFILIVGSEIWWRRNETHGELSRKFVHITVGTFVAFWPFFLSWAQIEILSLAFLIVVAVSKFFNILQAIHSVQRPTWGEVFFALAVGSIALITHNKWIYAVSLLQMALADGLAAVVGARYGGRHKYLIFGHTKSVIGTLTFFLVSIIIFSIFESQIPNSPGLLWLIGVSLVASGIENLSIKGFDNLLVPLLVALILVNG